MMNANDVYLEIARYEFAKLRKQAEAAVAQVSEVQFFHADGEEDNSIAVIHKHLSGNILSRWTDFLTTDGEKPDRDRDSEFIIKGADTFASLTERWERAWAVLLRELNALVPDDLARTVHIRGEALTVMQALSRQLLHLAYHVGQIVQLARHQVGPAWRTLSIPRGQSAAFNAAPTPHLPK